MIRLITTDIDGTLLPSGQKRIPGRVLDALERAIRQGITVVPCSGRMLSDLPKELLELPGVRYAVSCNGAAITDLYTGQRIFERSIPAGMAADLLRELENYRVYSCAYLADGNYNRQDYPEEMLSFYPDRYDFFRMRCKEDLPSYIEERGDGVDKIFIAAYQMEEKDRIRREMGTIPGIRVTTSSRRNLEITYMEADKGLAVSWLGQYLGIPMEETLAMGDNENDYNMMTVAGKTVVPANGTDIIRNMATWVVPECAQCGVAIFLESQILRKDIPVKKKSRSLADQLWIIDDE